MSIAAADKLMSIFGYSRIEGEVSILDLIDEFVEADKKLCPICLGKGKHTKAVRCGVCGGTGEAKK